MSDLLKDFEFEDLCRRELELCAVKPGETVIVLSQGADRLDYADAFMSAARKLGAEAYNIRLGNTSSVLNGPATAEVGINPLMGNQPAVDALKQADIVIDLVFLLWSREQHEIQDAGTRILTVIEPRGTLKQMFPTPDQRRRVEFSAELIRKAKTMRITNAAGMDVTYQLGHYKVVEQFGYTDTPGRWEAWPGGFVFTGGNPEGVDGTVVIDTGDIIVMPFRSYVDKPITLKIERGAITEISGGRDAEMLREYLASYNDPRAYQTSHIGWGVNENVTWTSTARTQSFGQEARAFYGNVMFAIGPNTEMGGDNDTPAHVDIPMRNCSLWLDDLQVIDEGEFLIPELDLRKPALVKQAKMAS